eukprot:NODE_3186_length_931_cov_47.093284_g3165_i0.p1 GENE.NODE_3186_length_931_cov_47.093284_g3165_i0~~NODE_3186_length_931_cov_47.093284_g3165_i0.p1  ORF type:complete len:194 (-),score=33.75 NODE_3186_length_931_cov_47.093284_g3165_i0:348-875(-)
MGATCFKANSGADPVHEAPSPKKSNPLSTRRRRDSWDPVHDAGIGFATDVVPQSDSCLSETTTSADFRSGLSQSPGTMAAPRGSLGSARLVTTLPFHGCQRRSKDDAARYSHSSTGTHSSVSSRRLTAEAELATLRALLDAEREKVAAAEAKLVQLEQFAEIAAEGTFGASRLMH